MKKNYWKIVNSVIDKSDILLLVLDARMPSLTRNEEIEHKVKLKGKKLIYVLNKCDLMPKKWLQEQKKLFRPAVFVSSTQHLGTTILRNKIIELTKKDHITIGVLGYPNTGKSSVINALRGKSSAKASSVSGYTRGVQKIRIDARMMILDTPGVIPYGEKDENKHVLIGTANPSELDDPELCAMELIDNFQETIKKYYKVEGEDSEEILENIAKIKKKLAKGGVLDTLTTAKIVIKDWQQGKIKIL